MKPNDWAMLRLPGTNHRGKTGGENGPMVVSISSRLGAPRAQKFCQGGRSGGVDACTTPTTLNAPSKPQPYGVKIGDVTMLSHF